MAKDDHRELTKAARSHERVRVERPPRGQSRARPGRHRSAERNTESRDTQRLISRLIEILERPDLHRGGDANIEQPWEDSLIPSDAVLDSDPRRVADRMRYQPFAVRLALAGREFLLKKDDDDQNQAHYTLYLSTLQRMVLHDLQEQLLSVATLIHKTKVASRRRMSEARSILTEYTNAVRDYDYMIIKAKEAKNMGLVDSFEISSRQKLGEWMLRDAGVVPERWRREGDDPGIYSSTKSKWRNLLPGGSRTLHAQNAARARFLDRLWMGLTGGVAVIVPMVIMVLRTDLLTRLLTTAVSVLAFAFVAAWYGDEMRGETLIGLVAAYAAVLVVFIGVS